MQVVFGLKKGQRLPRLPSGVKAEVVTLESVIKAGKEHPRSHIPPQLGPLVYQRARCLHMPASLPMPLAATLSSMLNLVCVSSNFALRSISGIGTVMVGPPDSATNLGQLTEWGVQGIGICHTCRLPTYTSG